MTDEAPRPLEICPEFSAALQTELIRQYHERIDISPLMSDEDFDGLVL